MEFVLQMGVTRGEMTEHTSIGLLSLVDRSMRLDGNLPKNYLFVS